MMAKTTTRCVSREDRRKIPDLALTVHKKRREDRLEIVGDMTGKDSLRTSHDAFLPKENKKRREKTNINNLHQIKTGRTNKIQWI
jgi:hypothetical protein